jgi:hypothetical protein
VPVVLVGTDCPRPRAMSGESAIEKGPGGSSFPMVGLEPAWGRGEILWMARAPGTKAGKVQDDGAHFPFFSEVRQISSDAKYHLTGVKL